MGRNIKTFTEAFKKEVAIEALKERMPVNEIAAKYGIVASMVIIGKKSLLLAGSLKKFNSQRRNLLKLMKRLMKPIES